MNKILTLYNLEFKRIYKFFFVMLLGVVGLNIAINGFVIYTHIKHTAQNLGMKMSLDILKMENVGVMLMTDIYAYTRMVLALAVIACLVYAIIIWYRDFIGKSKVSYTLFMLPQNKFNIYISKLITIVSMIYIVQIVQFILWAINLILLNYFAELGEYRIISSLYNNFGDPMSLIQLLPIDFFIINVIGVILVVVLIFTAVLMQLSYKKIGLIIAPLYVIFSVWIYFYFMTNNYQPTDRLMINNIYFAVQFGVCTLTSYKLLNKKVYV